MTDHAATADDVVRKVMGLAYSRYALSDFTYREAIAGLDALLVERDSYRKALEQVEARYGFILAMLTPEQMVEAERRIKTYGLVRADGSPLPPLAAGGEA